MDEHHDGWLGLFQRTKGGQRELRKEMGEIEKLLKQAKRKKDYAKQAQMLDKLGCLNFRMNDPGKAMDSWMEILTLYNRSKQRSLLATAYSNMAVAYRAQQEDENADKFLKKSLAINEQAQNKPGLMLDYFNMAMLSCERSEFEQANEFLHQSMTVANDISDTNWLLLAALHRSEILFYMCYHKEALEGFEFLVNESERIKAADWVIQGLCGISRCYARLGDYYYAFQSMEDAQETAESTGDRTLRAFVKTYFSDLFLQLGDADKARKLAMEAKEITLDAEDPLMTLLIFRLMATVNARRGMSENSRKYLDQALEIARTAKDQVNEGHVLFDLANLEFSEGKHREAAGQAEQAGRLIAVTHNRPLEADFLILKGRIAQAVGEIENSFSFRIRALKLAEEIKIPELIWKANYNLGRMYHAQNQFEEAYANYLAAIGILDFIASHLRTNVLADVFFKEKNRLKVFQDLIMLLLSRDRVEEARYYYNRIELPEMREKLKHLFKNE